MATSFKTRKALGRRYGQDPALLLEAERLQQEYGLMPGREARAQQASQFQQGLAQNQAQFDTQQENAKSAGMVGTAANLATTGAMIRGYTMQKGEPFFGQTASNAWDKAWGNAPAQSQPVAGYTAAGAGGGATAGYGAGWTGGTAEAPMSMLEQSGMSYAPQSIMTNSGTPYIVNPVTTDISAVGLGAPATEAATGAEAAGMLSGAMPYALGAGATYLGGKGMSAVTPEGTAVHRTGDFITGTMEWPVTAVTDPGKAINQAQQFVTDYVTKPIESVVNFFGGLF
jgi:hypothetical protein